MGIFKRPRINFPLTSLDVKGINDFFETVMFKLFGNIDMADLNSGSQGVINSKLSLVHTGEATVQFNVPVTYQLPDEFKGKQFKALPSVKQVNGLIAFAITSINCWVDNYNYENGTFQVNGWAVQGGYYDGSTWQNPSDTYPDLVVSFIAIA